MNTENQLQQVIDLIEKTGDKAIVLEQNRPAYVMMTLKDYERLILGKSEVRGLTEDELLDKINREIAVWKSEQERVKEIEDEYTDLEKEWEPDLGLDWRDEQDRGWIHDEYDREIEREIKRDMERAKLDEDFDEDVFGEDIELPPFDLDDRAGLDEDDKFEIPGLDPSTSSGSPLAPSDDGARFEEDKFYVEPME